MDMGELFRRFFGIPSRIPPNWDGKHPDWPDDRGRRGDDGDGVYFDDDVRDRAESSDQHPHSDSPPSFEFFFGVPNGREGLDDMFEHFQGGMWRQMESIHRQMEEMMKSFGAIDFPSVEELPSPPIMGDSEEKTNERRDPFSWFQTPSPFFGRSPNPKVSPRDFMLKDNEDQPSVPSNRGASSPSEIEPGTRPIFSLPSRRMPKVEKKEDTDLDGKLSEEEILSLIKTPQPQPQPPSEHQPQPRQPRFFSSGSSVTFTTIQGADGKVEQKRVVRNSSGQEETTITRSLGDQSHSVKTITEQDGRQEKHETFQNMDEKDLGNFEEQWNRSKQRPRIPTDRLITPAPAPRIDNRDQDLFSRFFGWRDK